MANRRHRFAVLDSVIGGSDDRSVFERARWAGFAGVEATITRRNLSGQEDGRLRSLQRASASTGLAVTSFVLDHHNLGGIADRDPRAAARAVEEVRLAIDWASELQATAILVPFFGPAELLTESDRLRALAAFHTLCPAASAAGVELLYEGPLPAQEVVQLASEIDSSAFGCYFDTANLVFRGLDPPTEIRRLGPLVRRVHVKDVRARKGDVHPGRGRVDFAECARALDEIGYEGWLVFETPPGPPPLAARDVSFVRSVFGSLDEAGGGWPLYGVRVDADLDGIAPALRQAGVRAVQLAGRALDTALGDPLATRQVLARSGLRNAALAPRARLVARDAAVREEALDGVVRCLEAAPSLGTWVVTTGTGTLGRGNGRDSREWASEEAWAKLASALEQLLPVAERRDVVLAIEGSAATMLKTPSQLLLLLEQHPSPNLQVVADPYSYLNTHLLPAHERVSREFLELLEDRFVLARLDDVAVSNGGLVRSQFGLGDFAQEPYLEFLRKRRPDLPLIFEGVRAVDLPAVLARAAAVVDAG